MVDTDVAVVGDVNVDAVPDPLESDLDLSKEGQHFVDNLDYRRGGQAANFAVKYSRLGKNASLHGKVGQDRWGEFLADHLKSQNVDPKLKKSENVKTGTTMVLPRENGDRTFVTYAENNAELRYSDIDTESIKESKHLARRGVWFSEHMLKSGNKKLLREAKSEGLETSIDLHWDPHWSRNSSKADKRRRMFLKTLEHADFLMCNEDEIKQVTKKKELAGAAEKVWDYGNPTIVVHQGENGSMILGKDGKIIDKSTEKVENPQNPTGTGDVFDASFLHSWRDGKSLEKSAEIATQEAVNHLKGKRVN
ncbi:MAG: fructokinase [Candidatus Nanohaloarchaea archaeon]|jgi:fructokinase